MSGRVFTGLAQAHCIMMSCGGHKEALMSKTVFTEPGALKEYVRNPDN